jgi:hypothetical protein
MEGIGMSLTHQQEAFAQHVASGKSQAEAYRLAYPKSLKWKPDGVWNKASALMADVRVSARVRELKAELDAKALWKREDSVRILSAIAEDQEASRKDKTGAVKVLNEMHGYNAPVKVEHSGSVTAITRKIIDK